MLQVNQDPQPGSTFAGQIVLQPSPCYDFLVSLRVLYNPAKYERAQRWIKSAKSLMGAELFAQGRPFFAGGTTALPLGLIRLVPQLPTGASVADLLDSFDATSVEEKSMLLLDTGDTSKDVLDYYESVLGGADYSLRDLKHMAREATNDLAPTVVRLVRDPAATQNELASFLRRYNDCVFESIIDSVKRATVASIKDARVVLGRKPTLSAVSKLTGGYTLSSTVHADRVVVAPSVFIYPYMASRVDEQTGQSVILYGVKDDRIVGHHELATEDVLNSAKALANPHRLEMVSMLRTKPMLQPEIVAALELSQPTVHHHLAILRSSGLIRQERTANGMLYSSRPDGAASLVQRITDFLL